MSAYRADLDALMDLVAQIEAFTARAEALGDELDGEVHRLQARWRGAAADAHGSAHDRWRSSAAQLRAVADELRDVVAVAHRNYSSAASVNLRMWS
jgi:WXG100 family type VII secretion target